MRTVPVAGGHVAFVDDEDYELVSRYRWHAQKSRRRGGGGSGPYASTNVRRPAGTWTSLRMHTLLTGSPVTDHINHNGLDNQRANLRPANASQNAANSRPMTGGTSRYKGVHWCREMRRWRAQIQVNKKLRHLGYFTDELEAAMAYASAACDAWGPYAFAGVSSE